MVFALLEYLSKLVTVLLQYLDLYNDNKLL